MKRGFMLPLVLGILATVVYMLIVSSAQKKLEASGTMQTVFVASRDIKERELISPNMLTRVRIPKAYVQKDAFTYNSDADLSRISNTIARVQIPKGNQISKYAVTSLSPEVGLSSKIPVQMRGVVISVPTSVASMIKPDDNIDILVTFDAIMKDGSRQKVTMTLLQNIKVLGVGSDLGQGLDARTAAAMRNDEEDASAYTDTGTLSLSLSPQDAQYLALAQTQEGSEVSVILRSPGDVTSYVMQIATFDRLFN